MERLDLFVDLGYGIPMYAILEVLRAIRDDAKIDSRSEFDYSVRCNNGFHIEDSSAFGMCLMANARCVGLELSCLQVKKEVSLGKDFLIVHFNKRKYF